MKENNMEFSVRKVAEKVAKNGKIIQIAKDFCELIDVILLFIINTNLNDCIQTSDAASSSKSVNDNGTSEIADDHK